MAETPREATPLTAAPTTDTPRMKTLLVSGLFALLGSIFLAGGIFQIKHQPIAGIIFLIIGGAGLGAAFYVYSRPSATARPANAQS